MLGWLLARGMLRLDLRRFFTWTGAFLIIVAAGVLAYAVHDLQEAGVLPGPFRAPRRSTPRPAPSPSGWRASRSAGRSIVTAQIPPGSALAAVLQATVGFMPQMTWLQVIAWALYVAIVGAFFIRGARGSRRRVPTAASRPTSEPTGTAAAEPAGSEPADVPDPQHQGAA